MLGQCHEQIVPSNCAFLRALSVSGDSVECGGHALGVSRGDAFLLSTVYIMRVLHKLLLLDSVYGAWQTDSPAASGALFVGETSSTHIPPGTVVACFDVEHFVPHLMNSILTVIAAASAAVEGQETPQGSSNGTATNPDSHITTSSLQAAVEHGIILLFGLLATTDRCLPILRNYVDFGRFIRAVTVRVPGASTRRAAARRIVECSLTILMKCRDDYGGIILESDKAIRRQLFHYIFYSVVTCTHPGYNAATIDRSSLSSRGAPSSPRQNGVLGNLRAPERYRNAGEAYSLMACLLTVRSRPELMTSRTNMGPFTSECGSREALIASANGRQLDFQWVEEADLCQLFVEKLFTHHSQESFRSVSPDATLVGILRMLIVLANAKDGVVLLGQIYLPSVLFNASASPRDKTGLIAYLFCHCLFSQLQSTTTAIDSPEAVAVCQTPRSRHLAYALLLSLCRTNMDNMRALMKILVPSVEITKKQTHHVKPTTAPLAALVVRTESLEDLGAGVFVDSKELTRRTRDRKQVWEYDPNVLVKDKDAFLGLVNQGATCYMNAFLQQLYHVKRFSDGMLAIDSRETADPTNEQVLFELQVLFAYLRLSQKNYCDTRAFCKTFRDFDGEVIRMGEQKDANEFAGMLFEKLEANKACAELLKRCFGGTLVWQTISTESTYRSEREEPFYMLTAEVKDKASLEDSLELYVTGEMLTGDNKVRDADCGRKVDALRRCAVRTLPDVLIVHLKRFEFNLETMNRRKLNDLITFPDNLDMFPYTEEGIQQAEQRRRARTLSTSHHSEEHLRQELGADEGGEDSTGGERLSVMDEEDSVPCPEGQSRPQAVVKESSHYQYQLKGIIAHTGAIDSGHYYSFIKQSDLGKWLEFNDRQVLPFDEESIPAECFGGPSTARNTENSSGGKSIAMKQYSAYMLFYERVKNGSSAGPVNGTNASCTASPTASANGGTVRTKKMTGNTVGTSPEERCGYEVEEKSEGGRGGGSAVAPSVSSSAFSNGVGVAEAEAVSSEDDESSEDECRNTRQAKNKVLSSTHRPSAAAKIAGSFHSRSTKIPKVIADPTLPDVSTAVRRSRSVSMLRDCNFQHPANWKASLVGSAECNMSDPVVKAIWAENTEFVLDKARFSVEYFLFYAKLLEVPLVSEILSDIAVADDVMKGGGDTHGDNYGSNSLTDYLSTIVSYDLSSGSILARLVLSTFEFCVDVLARARAQQCVPHFIEKLEEIIMRDSMGICAEVLLTELARDPTYQEAPISPSRHSAGGEVGVLSSPTRQKDMLKVERNVHPLLVTIFLQCPHTFTVSSVSRLLMWCVKMLRPAHAPKYLTTTSTCGSPSPASPDETTLSSSPPNNVLLYQQQVEQLEACAHYTSCVSRFVGKLLLLLEYFRPEEAIESRGRRVCVWRGLRDAILLFAALWCDLP